MIRQLIVGRLGPDDNQEVPSDADEQRTDIQLVIGEKSLDHGIGNAIERLKGLGLKPSEVGVDLLVLAALVYVSDTRISRVEQSQDSWTREIRLVVPVSDPALWTSSEPILKQMLDFLTGDRWLIGFRPRPDRFASIALDVPPSLLPPSFDSLSLFSGGLDSLIGAIDLLEEGATPLLVSHAGDGAASDAQKKLFVALKRHYHASSFERLRLSMVFVNGIIRDVGSETSTRGRSFLFFALGVFAGTAFDGRFTLKVPENGLIALNVPLDLLRLGANSTRTTHPYYMARWNELLDRLGIDGEIRNPYWNKTKGEMTTGVRDSNLLKSLAAESLSCSAPAKGRFQGLSIGHCGFCLPCLIRRAALKAAWGPGVDLTPYTENDLQAHPLDTREAVGVQIRSFQYAIARLRAKPQLADVLIHKPGSLADEADNQGAWADVYRRGLLEVDNLISGVNTRPS